MPSIKKARDAGVLVIALDTPTQPQDATDALFATDNYKAGFLIGQYARASLGDKAKTAIIATLDTGPGISVGVLYKGAKPTLDTTKTTTGRFGAKGVGAGLDGIDGQKADILEFP